MIRVLVVEDDTDIAEMLAVMLRMDGLDVRTVHNGDEALRALDNFAADVVVTDLSMEQMDGLQLCLALRSSSEFAATPVLIYTAAQRNDPRLTEAKALGGVEVAAKPLGATAVAARVRGLLERPRGTDAVA